MGGLKRFGRSVRPEALSAAVIVLILFAGSVLLIRTAAHRPQDAGVAKVALPPVSTPTASAKLASPSVSAAPTPRALPTEVRTPGPLLPIVTSHLPVTPTVSATGAECVGRMPSGHRAEAKCDVGKHQGLPSAGCRWDGFCAWWDSWGAVLGGPADVPITVTSAGDLDVSWDIDPAQLKGNEYSGPLKEFVLRVFADGSYERLRQYELGVDVRAWTVSGLGPGKYDVCVMELNDSGLGGLCPGTVTIPPPSPSPTSTASGTPAASPTPSTGG